MGPGWGHVIKTSIRGKLTDAASGSVLRELDAPHFSTSDAIVAAETSPVALVLTSLDGEILYANPAFQALFDAPDLAARSGMSLQEISSPYFDAALLSDLARTGEPGQFELRALRGTATRWWCQARRARGESGMPKWLVLTFTELEPAASPEPASPLQDARDRVERLDRSGSWSLCIPDSQQAPDGRMSWSRGMSELLRCEHSERPRAARDWLDVIHRSDRAAVVEVLRGLTASGRDYSIEYRLANGGRRLHSRGQFATRSPLGVTTIIGVERDVTETVSLPRASLGEHYVQRALASSYEVPAFALDRHYRLRWFNPLFVSLMRELWGVGPGTGWTLEQIVRQPSQRRRAIHSIRQSLQGMRSAAEWLVAVRDIEARCYDLIYNPIFDDGGRVLGVVAMAADVTAKRLPDRRSRRGSASIPSNINAALGERSS